MSKDQEAATPTSGSASSGRPFRRQIGGDLYITSFPGDSERLWLDAGFAVEGWHARSPVRPGRPEFPGTPVRVDHGSQGLRWKHDWWEITATRMQDDARGAERFLYELRPWGTGQIVRQGFELTPDSGRRLTSEHRAAARRRVDSDRAALFMPFYGLLPTADQEQIENRHGLPPGRATVLTASLLLLLSTYCVMLAIAAKAGHGGSDVRFAEDFKYLLGYLVLESLVRLSQGILGQPMGSALVVVPLSAVRALAPKPRVDEQLPAVPGALPQGTSAWLEASDTVRTLPASPEGRARLEVLSPLPKDHWRAQVDLMNFRDVAYVLEERQEVPGGYRFLLEEQPPGIRKTRWVHSYDPREIREVYKEQRRLKSEAWLETLAPLVGLTEPALQMELADFTRYKPYRGVFQSILFSLIFGFLALRTGWVMLFGGAPSGSALSDGGVPGAVPADYLIFLGLGVAMLWENLVRAVRLYRGEITHSFLGRLVSPFARRALRWRHDPSWPYPPTT